MIGRLPQMLRTRRRDPRWVGAAVTALLVVALAVGGAVLLLSGGDDAPRPAAPEAPGFSISPQGDDVPRLAPVRVTFERPPSERDGKKLLQLEPAPAGTYRWLSDRTLLFEPEFPGLLRGQAYTLKVAAAPEAGLTEAKTVQFTTAGKLTVETVIPAPGDLEVPKAVQVLVQFSRSVAPLTLLSEQPTGSVITFDPPLAGTGEWLNTSLYRFIPDDLAPHTKYSAKVPASLTGAADGVLDADYTWSFTTFGPALDSVTPEDNTKFVGLTQPVVLTFNQPMDRTSVQGGVSITSPAGAAVPGFATAWSDGDRTVTFTPTGQWARLATYTVAVKAGLSGANGGTSANARTTTFASIGSPAIAATEPKDGATGAARFGVRVAFTNPMDMDTFEGLVTVSGIDPDKVELSLYDPLNLYINASLKPSTAYTVSIAAGAKDRYGQPLPAYSFSFTTGALSPSVSFAIPNNVGVYSSSHEPVLFYHSTNTASATFTLYPLTAEEMRLWVTDNGNMPVTDPRVPWQPSQPALRTWTETNPATKDQVLVLSTSLGNGGVLPKGDYFVRSGSAAFNSALAFSVVDTALVTKVSFDEVLVWALDMDSGKPVANLALNALEYSPNKGGATIGDSLASTTATTDTDGLASFKFKPPSKSTAVPLFQRPGYLITTATGSRRGIEATSWQQGSYQLDMPQEYIDRAYVGHLYTERPIYRPGEEVLFKGIIREDDDAHYAVPEDEVPLDTVIRDAQGKELSRVPVTLNSFGSFAGAFTLPTTAAIGDYTVQIEEAGSGPQVRYMPVTGTSFAVAEFRKPEFQVEVTTDKPAYAAGDTITANALATFFFGGGVSAAKVDWNVMATPTQPHVPGYERYSFGDIDFARRNVVRDPQRATGTSPTDAEGKSTFTTPAALKGGEGAQAFQISALVNDQSGQGVAGVTTVTVHPADGYAGIRPAEYVAAAGDETEILVVTVDTEGKPQGNRKVTVGIYERKWVTTKEQTPEGARRYRSDPVDTLLETIPVTTGANGEASVKYTPKKSGQVRLVADYTDPQGRTARSAAYLWVSSGEFASWQVTNDDIVKLVADRDQYEVGDTAEVLVPAPFEGAIGLVTTERGKIISHDVRQFPTNAERLRIPIEDGSVPNIFVGVVLYRPPTAEDPVPRYKIGYAQLSVSTKTRQLDVQITPDRVQAKPGDKVAYDIKVTDSTGKGVKAEVSVAVVDKAVLALIDERSVTGLRAFWFERGLGVQSSSSLAVSINRWNDVIGEPRQGGKGGSGGEERLRQDFKNTAYWAPQLTTKDDGTLRVEVTMPDNLTTWRLQARAISGNTMVGEATNELVSTQPLLLRPALPRFLRVGDEVRLRLLVRNATDKASDVSVNLTAEGVDVSGGSEKKATVKPGESAVLEWPAKVATEGEAQLTFRAKGSGGLSDSIVQRLPIYLDVTPEAMATNGVVTGESKAEGVYLPGFALLKGGSLDISVQPTLTGSLAGDLARFAKRPGEIVEPTTRVSARAIATMAIVRAEKSAGRDTSSYEPQIATDLATLVGRQRPDGGFAWCEHPLCGSDPQVTAWVLSAFGEALRDGRGIDSGAVERSRAYVTTYINRVTDVESPADVNEKAQLLYALDSSLAQGQGSVTLMRALQQQYRAKLANWGRAYLILGLLHQGLEKDDPAVSQLLNDLSQSMIASATGNHWEDEPAARSAHTGTRTTALVLMALVRADPQHPLIEETVRWLMSARGAESWSADVEAAQAILSLSEFAASTGELAGNFSYRATINGDTLLDGRFQPGDSASPVAKKVPLTDLGAGKLSVVDFSREAAAAGRLYYAMVLRYQTPAKDVEAVSRGFGISHEYSLITDPEKAITSAKLGETVRVKLTIVAPAERNYVVIEDLLPAGLEPVDTRLNITDPKLVAKLEEERRKANRPKDIQYEAPWWGWYINPWQQVDTRDDRVTLRTTHLGKGVYEYIYYARATTPGDFFTAPAHAEESFFPEVFGRSDSGRFVVEP